MLFCVSSLPLPPPLPRRDDYIIPSVGPSRCNVPTPTHQQLDPDIPHPPPHCILMSEVDYSPEAYVRYHQKQKRVADWVDSTSTHSQRFSNPSAPSVAGSSSSHRSVRAPSAVHVAHSRSGSVAPGPSRAGSAAPSRSASVPPFLAPPPPTGFGPAPGYAGVPTQPGSGMYYAPPGSIVILPSGHSSPSVVSVPSQVPSPTSMPASPLSMGSSPPSMAGSAHAAIPRDLPGSVAPSLSYVSHPVFRQP